MIDREPTKVHQTRSKKAAITTKTAAGTTGNTTAKTTRKEPEPEPEPEPESESESDDSSLSSSIDDENEKEGPAWEHEPLTDRKKLILERKSDTFDLKDPFWAYARIQAALQLSAPRTLEEAERLVGNAENADVDETPGTETQPSDTPRRKRAKKIIDTSKMLNNNVFESTAYQAAENLQWSFDIGADVEDHLIQPTVDDYERIAMHEKWLDAEEYQFDNEDEACANLDINKSNPRLKGMLRCTALKFWQPVCINRVVEIMLAGLVLGAIIADVVGVGKTWEAVGFLLHVSTMSEHCERLLQLI